MYYSVIGHHQQEGTIVVPIIRGLWRIPYCTSAWRGRRFSDRQVDAESAASMEDEPFADFAIGRARSHSDELDGRWSVVDAPSQVGPDKCIVLIGCGK